MVAGSEIVEVAEIAVADRGCRECRDHEKCLFGAAKPSSQRHCDENWAFSTCLGGDADAKRTGSRDKMRYGGERVDREDNEKEDEKEKAKANGKRDGSGYNVPGTCKDDGFDDDDCDCDEEPAAGSEAAATARKV